MDKFRIFKWLWLIQCLVATYFALTKFFIWYMTTPRGQIPFYDDWVAGILGIALFFDWLIGILA